MFFQYAIKGFFLSAFPLLAGTLSQKGGSPEMDDWIAFFIVSLCFGLLAGLIGPLVQNWRRKK